MDVAPYLFHHAPGPMDFKTFVQNALNTLLGLFSTETRFWVSALLFYTVWLVCGVFVNEGKKQKAPGKHIKNALGWGIAWLTITVMLVVFSNVTVLLGWVAEVTFVTLNVLLVGKVSVTIFRPDSEGLRFIRGIVKEVSRLNFKFAEPVGNMGDMDSGEYGDGSPIRDFINEAIPEATDEADLA